MSNVTFCVFFLLVFIYSLVRYFLFAISEKENNNNNVILLLQTFHIVFLTFFIKHIKVLFRNQSFE